MSVKGAGHRSWVSHLAGLRNEAAKEGGAVAPPSEPKVLSAPELPTDAGVRPASERLAGLRVPEKVAGEHGAALLDAMPEVAAVAAFAGAVEGFRSAAFNRILDQYYKVLGQGLALQPAEARGAYAKQAVGALHELLQAVGSGDHLVPALAASIGLFDSATRLRSQGRLQGDDPGFASAARQALGLRTALSPRAGVGRALLLLPQLVEQLELSRDKLGPIQRQRLLAEVVEFMTEIVPPIGFDQDVGAKLAKAVGDAAKDGRGEKISDILAGARRAFLIEFKPRREELLANLEPPAQVGETYGEVLKALKKVATANPTAPDALSQALNNFKAAAQNGTRNGANRTYYSGVAALVSRFAKEPAALPLLAFLGQHNSYLYRQGDDMEALAKERDPKALALGLSRLIAKSYNQLEIKPEWLDGVPEELALPVALAALTGALNSHNALVLKAGLAEGKGAVAKDQPYQAVLEMTQRLAVVLGRLGQTLDGEAAERVSLRIAREFNGDDTQPLNTACYALSQAVNAVKASLPRADLEGLVIGREEVPSLWQLVNPSARFRAPPAAIFNELVQATRQVAGKWSAETQTALARVLMQVAAALGNLDGEVAVPKQRVLTDLAAAVMLPEKLQHGKVQNPAAALRARPSFAAYVESHAELPPELAASAGLHLDAGQLGWVQERMEAAHGRDTKRALRDFVWACIAADRKDFIDVVRESKAPQKAISRLISTVGTAFRRDQLHTLDFDDLSRGIAAGEDPVAALIAAKNAAALREMPLGLKPEEITEEGMAQLESVTEAVRNLLSDGQAALKAGNVANQDGIDLARLREPFLDVLRQVARGKWPQARYETAVAERQLGMLTAEQREIWKMETVLSADSGGMPQALIAETAALARGLRQALEKDVQLAAPGLPDLGWNAASTEKLEARLVEQVAALRNTEAGTAAHKDIAKQASVTRDRLALLRFATAVSGAQDKSARELLSLVKPLMHDLTTTLNRLGQGGALEIAREISFALRQLVEAPRQGLYAVDEDGIDPLLNTTVGGCVHHTGFRAWALVGLSADANSKVIRTYDKDKFLYRTLMRLHPIETAGYKGPAIWINVPVANGGDDKHKALIYKVAAAKAAAMGIPLVTVGDYYGNEPLAGLGGKTAKQKVTFAIDPGHTQTYFNDYKFNGMGDPSGYGHDMTKVKVDAEGIMRPAIEACILFPKEVA